MRQVYHVRDFLARIEPGDMPMLTILLGSAQNVDEFPEPDMTANFRSYIDGAERLSTSIELQNLVLIPLTLVKIPAVKAEIRTGEIRARHAALSKSGGRDITA